MELSKYSEPHCANSTARNPTEGLELHEAPSTVSAQPSAASSGTLMPAPRLPWIKFWPEALDHPKFALLSDTERWTWIEVWGKASLQAERWTFASVAHAVKVTGRKAKDVRRLIEVGLIDEGT